MHKSGKNLRRELENNQKDEEKDFTAFLKINKTFSLALLPTVRFLRNKF